MMPTGPTRRARPVGWRGLGAGGLLLVMLAVAVPALATLYAPAPGATIARLTPQELQALREDTANHVLVLDTRSAESYAAGHIAGAVSFPAAALATAAAHLPADWLLVLYCQ